MSEARRESDILVIGGGQAGLAMGYHLRKLPHSFLIVERNKRIGDSWRNRYDSLHLFSPRMYSFLPGLPLPGDTLGFASKDEIADYLERYASQFELPVLTGLGVKQLDRVDGKFRATLDEGTSVTSRSVIIASGAFEIPSVPFLAQRFAPDVAQFSPRNYHNPSQVPPGTVLVVGDGATGRQIALELSRTHSVLLAHGRMRSVTPDFIFGKNNFWWMELLRLSRVSRRSLLGRYFMRQDPFPGLKLMFVNLRRRGVKVVKRLTAVEGKRATFADGGTLEVSSVVWATGYHDDSSWVKIPEVVDEQGNFVQERGMTSVPNLFFIGKSWQWTRASALIFGVTRDAEYLIPFISRGLNHHS